MPEIEDGKEGRKKAFATKLFEQGEAEDATRDQIAHSHHFLGFVKFEKDISFSNDIVNFAVLDFKQFIHGLCIVPLLYICSLSID